MYNLYGLIYPGQFQFTCHIVDRNGGAWFHYGIKTIGKVVAEGNTMNMDSKVLGTAKRCKLSFLMM
ncbi:hypothetical protein BD413DRAFT_468320 [Trametes elegans]|nr:hypothetical protein BD413DRAFT_488174 [Trametes elegans]KAI0776847.1 hypothetical protein BD413DRAFT_468320 [Trametes elegans]